MTAALFLLLSHLALAGERSVDPAALPAAVRTTLAEKYGTASVLSASTEVEDGAATWEARLSRDGHTFDVAFDTAGAVLEEEEVIQGDALPAVLQSAVAGYSGWTVKRIERSVTPSATVYEVLMTKGKQGQEIVFAADGTVKRTEKLHRAEEE